MVGSKASVPKMMLVRDDMDVVSDSTSNGFNVMRIWYVKVLNHHHHTKWEEEHKSLIRVSGSVHVSHFHFMDEPSLC